LAKLDQLLGVTIHVKSIEEGRTVRYEEALKSEN